MADWSELPADLLSLIATRLETQIDVLRFRSVCSSWRSSSSPKLYLLPKQFPSYTRATSISRCEISITHVTRNSVFLVRCPEAENHKNQTASACWLIKIRHGAGREKMHILHPLLDSVLKPLPSNLRKVLNLTKFQVIELGHEFVAQNRCFMEPLLESEFREYKQKVAFLWSSTNSNDFKMITKLGGRLAFLRSGQEEWTMLDNLNDLHDIICFNGKFYAIKREGITIVVDQYLNVSFLQQHVGSRSSRNFLVQSGDNLLAVEVVFLPNTDYARSQGNTVVGFRIFRFDEEVQKWDEMRSLGDQILFLGLRQAISVSASEFHWDRGNLVFYWTGLSMDPRHDIPKDRHIFVFDLETGTCSPLENCPAYCNLFWPPPEWVTSPESVISSKEVIGNSNSSVTSATLETKYKNPDSNSAICSGEIPGKCSERVTSAGQEVGSKRSPPSSKCSFKCCCF